MTRINTAELVNAKAAHAVATAICDILAEHGPGYTEERAITATTMLVLAGLRVSEIERAIDASAIA